MSNKKNTKRILPDVCKQQHPELGFLLVRRKIILSPPHLAIACTICYMEIMYANCPTTAGPIYLETYAVTKKKPIIEIIFSEHIHIVFVIVSLFMILSFILLNLWSLVQ